MDFHRRSAHGVFALQVKAGQNQAQWEVSPHDYGQYVSAPQEVSMDQMAILVASCLFVGLQEKGWIKPEHDPRGWFHW